MTVGFYAPLPPAPTGVADYAAALLTTLRHRLHIRLDSCDADVCLYHLGNNSLHGGIYRCALERPGAVVLHDAVLHHFLLGLLDRSQYVEEFVYNYGEWHRDLAGELWEGRARSAGDRRFFDYPMLRRIADASRAVVVHNPAAVRMVLAHAPNASVREIPHLWAPPPEIPKSAVGRFRSHLGLGPRTFLFGVMGHLRESKRLLLIARAFEEVRLRGLDAALVVAGRFISPDLERAFSPWLDRPGVLRIGWQTNEDFWLMAASLDACINLKHPGAGETSGITIRLMGLGKPVIVTEGQEVSRLPETACWKVAAGSSEVEELAGLMELLVRFPDMGHEIGQQAASYIARHHDLAAIADSYAEILRGLTDSSCPQERAVEKPPA